MAFRMSNYPKCVARSVSAGSYNFVLWDFVCAVEPLYSLELPVMSLKHGKAAVILAQTQNPASGMLDHASRFAHHLAHHRPDTTTYGRMAQRRGGITERFLPIQAQQVHGQSRELAHRVVESNLPEGGHSKSMPVLNSEWNCSWVHGQVHLQGE